MPANVETMTYRYAGRHDLPWHGLGIPIDRNEQVTTHEFMKKAGADWTAEKRQLYYLKNEGLYDRPKNYEEKFALVRSDNQNPLSIVSNQYKPVQNSTVFNFFKEFCDAGDMDLETGGVLDEGRTIWCLASIRKGFTLANDDRVTGHLLFSNSHDGNALRVKFTPIRIVCANTLAMAHADGSGYRMNHKRTFNPEEAKKVLGLSTKQMEQFKEQSEFLSTHRMDSIAFKTFLDRLYPSKEVAAPNAHTDSGTVLERPRAYQKGLDALHEQPGVEMSQDTWWSGYNAITYMLDHANRSDKSALLNSNWFGANMNKKQEAFELALEMAKE